MRAVTAYRIDVMRRVACFLASTILLNGCASTGQGVLFAGAVGGVSTLSADARSIVGDMSAEASLYKPENGAALNLLGGVHVSDYFSVQSNYVWNRNRLTLSALRSIDGTFYEERRKSGQHSFIADALLYFRNRESWARPYLSAGIGVVRFVTSEAMLLASRDGPARPPAMFVSTDPALRVAVGIDVDMVGEWRFRYSFSETISRNPVSVQLSPPAQRNLANFQNLFGAVRSF
jgi:hypothetical protein